MISGRGHTPFAPRPLAAAGGTDTAAAKPQPAPPSSGADIFNKTAGRDLLLLGLAAIAGFVLLMAVLAWASEATGGASNDALDPVTGTVTVALST